MDSLSRQLSPEQRLHLLLDAASDFAIFFTEPDGRICEWGAGAERVIGFTKDEALTLHSRDIFLPEDRAAGVPEQELATALAEGQANDERWHLRRGGEAFFAVGRMIALKDEDGHHYGFAKIVRDVTANKRMEQALQASDAQFRATFAQAPIGMVLTDLHGRIQRANPSFARLVDVALDDLPGRELVDFTAPEDRDETRRRIAEMLAERLESTTYEKRLLRADGTRVWVQNSATLLRDLDERPLCVIDLCQDISVLKLSAAELARVVEQRTGELTDKSRQLESFCYTISHDLRAPLRAIAGYAEFLREDYAATLPPPGLEFVRRIEEAAARLDRLIYDLLNYTQVGQGPLERQEVDLTTLLENVAAAVRRDFPEPGLRIELRGPLGRVQAHPLTLEHVFTNLLSNAVKFHRPDVPPRVVVSAEPRGERLRVWVEDNGIGVEPRHRERVFGMFERLHPELRIPGTGVGLAIVATAVERLGGTRGVEPNHPHGSRFWVELPR